jgi:2,3-diaminopropionate biosynthesis protein SbnB
MLLINEAQIRDAGIDWNATTDVIREAVECMADNDFSQPVKPYLRYRNLKNRIIAMPAFVGGNINKAGIKWIASFPENIKKGIPRAHSIVILNDADTGVPECIISTALLSIIRTASVSGLIIRCFDEVRHPEKIRIGIIGFGPIGQYHLKMCLALLGDRISSIYVYDIREPDLSMIEASRVVRIATSWEEAYLDADILITCTVSEAPYIDRKPKPGSLHINASLRDYKTDVFDYFSHSIIVDDWDEVCREKTDIEMMHLQKGLKKEDTKSIADVVLGNCIDKYDRQSPVMFNPMGMAIFDIAIGNFYFKAEKSRTALESGR